jgi:hypothetical protein
MLTAAISRSTRDNYLTLSDIRNEGEEPLSRYFSIVVAENKERQLKNDITSANFRFDVFVASSGNALIL